MLKQLLLDNRIFIAAVCLLVFIAGGLLYLQTVKRDAQRDVKRTQKRVEQRDIPKTEGQTTPPKPPPPGETVESGHWHGDEWHTGRHDSPAEGQRIAQEPLADTKVQGAPVIAPTQEASPRTRTPQEIAEIQRQWREWREWHDKWEELSDAFDQTTQEWMDALPQTPEELERFETDEKYKREVGRKISEALEKDGKAHARLKEHEKTKPPIPPTP